MKTAFSQGFCYFLSNELLLQTLFPESYPHSLVSHLVLPPAQRCLCLTSCALTPALGLCGCPRADQPALISWSEWDLLWAGSISQKERCLKKSRCPSCSWRECLCLHCRPWSPSPHVPLPAGTR